MSLNRSHHLQMAEKGSRILPGATLPFAIIVALLLSIAVALVHPGSIGSEAVPPTRVTATGAAQISEVPSLGGLWDGRVALRTGPLAELPEGEPPRDEHRPTTSPTSVPSPRSSPRPGERKSEPPVYAQYLKNPSGLGFAPDQTLFDTVYRQIKTQHIDNDPDQSLFDGVAKEAAALLKEAGVAADTLAAMPHDKTLPDAILRAFGGKVNASLLWYAMIRGVLGGTDDPYSVLMTPREYHMLMEQMQNETFGGIGVYIELDHERKNQLTVVEPLDGTPAARAGLLAGDQIVKIDGRSTEGMTLDMATAAIRGQIGTTVVVTVLRPGEGGLKDFAIRRAAIEVASVSRKMLADNVGYVRLRLFGARTGKELDEALDYLQKQGSRALIIDLRNNGGGYINAAVEVCSHYVPPGAVVTFITDKHGARRDYNGEARPRTRLPIVLLVNNFSASASEITAGCFKDYGVATLMGVKTFGKGSVQQLYPLPDGAALKLTIAHFFTPKGNKINKVGVQPDIKIEMEPKLVGRGDKDVQLRKALDYFKSKGII